MLVQDPSLNDSKFNGSVWVGSRVARISVVLFHMRRLKGSDDMKACASRLTGAEFLQLQEVVDMIAKKVHQVLSLHWSPLIKGKMVNRSLPSES